MRPSVNRALYTETDIRYQIVPTLSPVHHIIRSQPAPLVLRRHGEEEVSGGRSRETDHAGRLDARPEGEQGESVFVINIID